MARDLRKFVKPQFIEAVPLDLLRRLFGRYPDGLKGFDPGLFDRDPTSAREAVLAYLRGPEDALVDDLVVDLHRVADLATRQGLELLLQQARLRRVSLVEAGAGRAAQDPKHVALVAFLDHPEVFDTASRILALYESTGIAEFAGIEEGVEAQIDEATLLAMENAARALFEADLHGGYCEVDWYDDDAEIILVVSHGSPVSTTPVVENRRQRIVPLRAVEEAMLSYSAADGRLKMLGVGKARRAALAEIMASCILGRSGFFAGQDAQSLYTLAPIEREWPGFSITHRFDPSIKRVQVVEAQIDRVFCDLFGDFDRVEWSFVARDSRGCALERLRERFPDISFGSGDWRIGHVVLRVHIDAGGRRPSSVTVKVKPEAAASFRRQRFEGQIMELLRRNGFCRDRDADRTPVAAE